MCGELNRDGSDAEKIDCSGSKRARGVRSNENMKVGSVNLLDEELESGLKVKASKVSREIGESEGGRAGGKKDAGQG